MEHILQKYGISPDLPVSEKLELLEKAKQKLLRKLNHVFGDPEKEQQLNEEMDALEQLMTSLEGGGTFSMDDVELELRELSQTKMSQEERKEAEIFQKEKKVLAKEASLAEERRWIIDFLIFHMKKRNFEEYEQWCIYGTQIGLSYCMELLYQFYSSGIPQFHNPQKALYWLKKGAEAGEKNCCYDLGKIYMNRKSNYFNPKTAAVWFVKAADAEHPDAYLKAFAAFQYLKDYKKAEICLKSAVNLGVPGAAYRLALIYDTDENSTGERQIEVAKYWYEKAYEREADGDICYGLGNIYEELGEKEHARKLYQQGVTEFGSNDCKECLECM